MPPVTITTIYLITATLIVGCQGAALLSPSHIIGEILNAIENLIFEIFEYLVTIPVPTQNVKFLLYIPDNGTIELNNANVQDYIDGSLETKVLIHGWTENALMPYIKEMADAFLATTPNINIVAVDWSIDANSNYLHSAAAVKAVGEIVADFSMEHLGVVHLLGHSLGAHISGFCGKKVFTKTSRKVARITGLDVAGPLFETIIPKPSRLRLDKEDADFVDLIHTDGGLYGVALSYGDVDFYANGGLFIQPGCWTDWSHGLDGPIYCSHQLSGTFYTDTILDPKKYKAVECSNAGKYFLNLCRNNKVAYVGNSVDLNVSGDYYFST